MECAINRCELFNQLATVQAEDANEMKGKIYAVIQEMPSIDFCKGCFEYDRCHSGIGWSPRCYIGEE